MFDHLGTLCIKGLMAFCELKNLTNDEDLWEFSEQEQLPKVVRKYFWSA